MELLQSKSRKSSTLKGRPSLAFLFSSPKPTFAAPTDKPARYYDIADTPGYNRPPSSLIDRQRIAPELEADVRYACSLLAYRIEQGVPSPRVKPTSWGASQERTQTPDAQNAQIQSRYLAPSVGPEVAARKDKYDSGVGLTQKPSVQTMRILNSSHSDRRSDAGSVFSRNRCTTPGSVTTAAWDTDVCSGQASLKSPRHNHMRSMSGAPAAGYPLPQDHDTMTFLTGRSDSDSSAQTLNEGNEDADDVEVFLNPDATFAPTGVPSFCSPQTLNSTMPPSFGIPDGVSSNRNSTFNANNAAIPESRAIDQQPTTTGSATTNPHSNTNSLQIEPAVIVDSNGFMHIMTEEEESQRRVTLQNAVLAKMQAAPAAPASNNKTDSTPRATTSHAPLHSQPQNRPRPATTSNLFRQFAPKNNDRPATSRSRLATSWSTRSKTMSSLLSKRKNKGDEANSRPASKAFSNPFKEAPAQVEQQEPTVFQKVASFLGRWRAGAGAGAAAA